MLRRPPRSTRTATLFPYTTLFRSILINNAGVLRDKTFAKMEPVDFDFVVKVHLSGSAFATKACWDTFREQAYGRILMTASSRSEGHTSELQSLMRISYAVFCLKKKKKHIKN